MIRNKDIEEELLRNNIKFQFSLLSRLIEVEKDNSNIYFIWYDADFVYTQLRSYACWYNLKKFTNISDLIQYLLNELFENKVIYI